MQDSRENFAANELLQNYNFNFHLKTLRTKVKNTNVIILHRIV